MRFAARALAGLLLAAMGARAASPGLAAQWVIDDDGPADFRTLQQAADSPLVAEGDTLLVRPGRYVGNLLLDVRDLRVVSEAGPRKTILDGGQSGSVVNLYQRSAATRIEGFTITGGRGATGGGVWIFGGGPVVTRNVIEGNSAIGGFLGYGYGGGIEIYSSAAVITRNVVRGNTALDGGGGIDVYYSGPATPGTCCPVIAQNTVVGNHVTAAAGMGGGMLVSASKPSVAANIVAGNSAAMGGGLYVEKIQGVNDTPDVEANLLHGDAVDEVASNANWRLPSSNQIADPRLSPGPAYDDWPRSDSPAIDAAPASLVSAADLTGAAASLDGDLDGQARGDLGALEGRGDITGLQVDGPGATPGAAALSWDDSANGAVVFDLHRDESGPFLGGPQTCAAFSLTGTNWTDPDLPPVGSAWFYLVSGRGAAAGGLGLRSDLSPRVAPDGCYP